MTGIQMCSAGVASEGSNRPSGGGGGGSGGGRTAVPTAPASLCPTPACVRVSCRRPQRAWGRLREQPGPVLLTVVGALLLALVAASAYASGRHSGRLEVSGCAGLAPPAAGDTVAPEGSISADFAASHDYAGRPRSVRSAGGVVAADHGRCSEIGEQGCPGCPQGSQQAPPQAGRLPAQIPPAACAEWDARCPSTRLPPGPPPAPRRCGRAARGRQRGGRRHRGRAVPGPAQPQRQRRGRRPLHANQVCLAVWCCRYCLCSLLQAA